MGPGESGVGLLQEPAVAAVAVLQVEGLVRMIRVVLHGHGEPGRQGDDGQDQPEDAGGTGSPETHG